MTTRIRSFLNQDLPNWAFWLVTGIGAAAVGAGVFAATAAADQHNDIRYIGRVEYVRDWTEHKNSDAMRTEAVIARVSSLESQIRQANDQLIYNNRMTERNNAILERLDKR